MLDKLESILSIVWGIAQHRIEVMLGRILRSLARFTDDPQWQFGQRLSEDRLAPQDDSNLLSGMCIDSLAGFDLTTTYKV
jgi:hypothetical protein